MPKITELVSPNARHWAQHLAEYLVDPLTCLIPLEFAEAHPEEAKRALHGFDSDRDEDQRLASGDNRTMRDKIMAEIVLVSLGAYDCHPSEVTH